MRIPDDIENYDPQKVTVANQWERYSRSEVPPSATPAEREAARRAFYAGFCAMLLVVNHVGTATDAEGYLKMLELTDEMDAFIQSLLDRKHIL